MTIIAATDYSDIAENAVEYAAAVAKLEKAKLVLVNDLTVSVHTSNSRISAHLFQELFDKNTARLTEKAASLSKKYGIDVLPKATFSIVQDELRELMAEHHAAVVVVGMASKSLEQDLLGNTTTSVIKKLHSPVLAVPEGAHFAGAKKVLFACDVLHGLSAELLERVRAVARSNQSEVEVLLINETIEDLKEKTGVANPLKDIDDSLAGITYYYKNVKSDSVIDAIKEEVTKFQADLLIMVPQRHGFWDSIVHQSKTRQLASGLNIPLLSLPVSGWKGLSELD